jgi:hypothetical protein
MPRTDLLVWRVYEWCRPKSLADALQILGAAVATAWFVFTTDFGPWRPFLPLLAVALFGYTLWSISLVRQLLYPGAVSNNRPTGQQPVPAAATAATTPAVEFWLPSNWQPGFRHKTLPVDATVGKVFAEAVVLQVITKRRMQNVRFLIRATHRRDGQLETLAQLGSEVFTGVVQKDQEQSFVVMHRAFWNARGAYDDPRRGAEGEAPVRVEDGVIFFPENQSAAFPGALGEKYSFHVSILHDEGSENAYFSITLEPWQIFPMSRITSMDNVKPITRN